MRRGWERGSVTVAVECKFRKGFQYPEDLQWDLLYLPACEIGLLRSGFNPITNSACKKKGHFVEQDV